MKKVVLMFFIFYVSKLYAQEILTLEKCREMALIHNKEIAISSQQTIYAHQIVKSTRGNFFPNLSANFNGMYSTINGNLRISGGNLPVLQPNSIEGFTPTGEYAYFPGLNLGYKVGSIYMGGIQLDQPLYMGGKIRAAYKMATISQRIASLHETLTSIEVIIKTDQAYANVVKAKGMKVVAEQYNKLLKELMRDVENARKIGLAAKNDVLKIQVKLNESKISIQRAENALQLANMNLCYCIGIPLRSNINVSETLPTIPENVIMQTDDITARPEYSIIEQQTEIARQQVKLVRSELLPQIGIRGSYTYTHGVKINNEQLFDKGNFSILLNVSLPLFHFGKRVYKVKAYKAKWEQACLEQEIKNEQMLLQLTQTVNNLYESHLEVELTKQAVVQAEENMRISRKQYDAGLETLSNHLEAQLLWQQAYEQQIDASYKLYLQYVEYLKATGKLQYKEKLSAP